MSTEMPHGSCITHRPPREGRPWRHADPGYRTCADCADQLHRWLSPLTTVTVERPDGSTVTVPDSIPGLYLLLDPRPGVVDTGRRGPGFGSRSPASDHVLSLRDRRSQTFEDGDPHSAPGLLAAWVQWVWEERYEQDVLDSPDYSQRHRGLPTKVGDMCGWLDRQLDWLTRHEIIIEVHRELWELHSQLRSAAGEGGQPPVGYCIELIDGAECGAPIFMPRGTSPRAPDEPIRDLPELRCCTCGSVYGGRRLILLKLASERRAA